MKYGHSCEQRYRWEKEGNNIEYQGFGGLNRRKWNREETNKQMK